MDDNIPRDKISEQNKHNRHHTDTSIRTEQTIIDKLIKWLKSHSYVFVLAIFLLFIGVFAYNKYVNRAGLYLVEACLIGAGEKTGETFTDPTDGKVTEFRKDICRELEANTDLSSYAKIQLAGGKTIDITCGYRSANIDDTGYDCSDDNENPWTIKKIKRLGNER